MPNANLSYHKEPATQNLPQRDYEEGVRQVAEEQQMNRVHFSEWAQKIFQLVDSENPEEELSRIRKWVKLRRFYRGQQRGFFAPKTGEWVPINPDDYRPSEASLLLVNNQFRPQVKALSKEWSRSQSRLKCHPTSDKTEIRGAARYATALIDLYQRRQITEDFKQREAKFAFLSGNYFRYTYYSMKGRGGFAQIPVTEQRELPGYKAYTCNDCGSALPASSQPNVPMQGEYTPDFKALSESLSCQQCQSTSVSVEEVPGKSVTVITGFKRQRIGDVFTELVDPLEIKVHLRARTVEQTPYLRRKRLVMRQILRQQFPKAKINQTKISPPMYYVRELESATGNTNQNYDWTNYGSGVGDLVEFDQLWLDTCMYFDLQTDRDEVLADGRVIPAGTNLIDLFRDGMYLARAGDTLLDVQGENKTRYWTHGNYDIINDSFYGDGLEDMVQLQQFLNELQSLLVENIIHNASPKLIYNPHLIEHEFLSGKPKEMTPMSPTARRDDNPKDAIFQMNGMNLTQEVPISIGAIKEDMRAMSGAYLAMSGSTDPRLTTATGMAIARDSAIALLGPALALKSQLEVEWSYQTLLHAQEHWTEDRHAGLLGKFSEAEARWFRDCDILEDLEIIAEPGSWMPRTELEVRNDFLAFLTAGGVPLGFANPQVPVEVRQEAARIFRMPVDLDKLQPDIRNASLRIEQLRSIVQTLAQSGAIDPNSDDEANVAIIADEIPVDTYIDDHATFIDEYIAWLKTDDGRLSPQIIKEVLTLKIHEHMDAQEEVKAYAFQQEAKFQLAAQAMQGMVQNQVEADSPQAQLEAGQAQQKTNAQNSSPQSPTARVSQPLPGENLKKANTPDARDAKA